MTLSRSIILSAALVLPIGAAQAGVIAPQGFGAALEQHGLVDQVQYRYAGRDYCWYPRGWHGAGWYWCGYHLRVGRGWGGPAGWHGWSHHERARVGSFEQRGTHTMSTQSRAHIEPRGRIGAPATTTGQGGTGFSGGGGQR